MPIVCGAILTTTSSTAYTALVWWRRSFASAADRPMVRHTSARTRRVHCSTNMTLLGLEDGSVLGQRKRAPTTFANIVIEITYGAVAFTRVHCVDDVVGTCQDDFG